MSCDEDWNHLLDDMLVDNAGFVRWVREILESTTFRPSPPQDRVDVVITPMARAVLRPFHAIVMPGADAKQLGSVSTDTGWLGASLSRSMYLATPEDLRMAQWDAFGLLMTRRFVTCLRRQGHGSEPIAESPWLKQWARERGISWSAKRIPWLDHPEAYQPIKMPAPALIPARRELLPSFLSATSYEALRQCPYRFFAQSILRLRETEELEEGIDRSDYGIWLHEVIRQYHTEREQMLAMRTEEEEVDAWLETAERVMRDLGLNDDATRPYFQPYKASLPMMASAYVAWLLEHEKKGWHCVANESGSALDLPLHDVDAQIRLKGQIDRIDARYEDHRRIRMVIDYKTGSLSNLKEKTKNPQEDTQLPFYAAMAGADVSEAAYLHIDGKAVTLLPHPDVQEHADALIAGIQQDMTRIFEGAPMPALGEGSACTYCPARGLCRKDHWEAAMASEGAA
ncbi:MAG TPA: PD-(D/E)XK nuclease family protein [Aquabacterium sp.]|nr:PD-(D/E)XK nuclease family protein [Aquabacterium sp.]